MCMYRNIVHRAAGAKPADMRWSMKGFNDNVVVGPHLRSMVGNHLEQVNSLLFHVFVRLPLTNTGRMIGRLPEMMHITLQIYQQIYLKK